MNIVKTFKLMGGAAAAFALAGCASTITNLSPEKFPQNPSGIYTLSMRAHINDGGVVKGSVKPFIVIDEQILPMREISSRPSDRMYEFDYTMPKGRKDAKYYYILEYKSDTGAGGVVTRSFQSDSVYNLKVADRYIMNMQFDRGHIGAVVPVIGRGFNTLDKIKFGPVYATVESVSRDSISFVVPPLPSGKTYDVELESASGKTWIGAFRIDRSEIEISPAKIDINTGDVVNVIFNIGFKAGEKGFYIDVKTNIPSAITMGEVFVKPGQDSAVVPLKGASDASGKLYINARGFAEKVVPVRISPAQVKADPVDASTVRQAKEQVNEVEILESK
ncbi:MAG: hypothetical protein J6T16_03880 [Opitutales bacterium]|nr:hypothetical protein [Opitutales bacterium]